MKWLDRYISAVEKHLPKKQKKDVGEELKSLLEDELEARQEAKSAPIDEQDILEVLKKSGHPMQVAAGYQEQRVLISENVFPAYKRALRLTLTVIAAFLIGITVLKVLSGSTLDLWLAVPNLVSNFVSLGLMAAAVVTLIFHTMDGHYAKSGFFDDWDPRSLPDQKKKWVQISSPETVFEIFMALLLMAMLNGWLHQPILNQEWGGIAQVQFSPQAAAWLPWINLILGAGILIQCINLFQPHWTRSKLLINAAISGIGACVVSVLFKLNEPFVFDSDVAKIERILDGIGNGLKIFLGFIMVVMIWEGVRDIYRAVTIDE